MAAAGVLRAGAAQGTESQPRAGGPPGAFVVEAAALSQQPYWVTPGPGGPTDGQTEVSGSVTGRQLRGGLGRRGQALGVLHRLGAWEQGEMHPPS